jgi:hypothetical protein
VRFALIEIRGGGMTTPMAGVSTRYALTCIVLAACGGSGKQVRQDQLDRITIGETAWTEAEKILGAPSNLMDSTNTPAGGYFSAGCGVENDPVRVAQYVYANKHDRTHASTELVIDKNGIVCHIKRASGGI